MEYLRVVWQIQNVPEKVILQRKQTLTEFPDKKFNKSRIVLIKAKLAYRSASYYDSSALVTTWLRTLLSNAMP